MTIRSVQSAEQSEGASTVAREQGNPTHARQLLEALPMAIYTTDTAGRLTFYNQAAADLWGYHPWLGETRWCGSWRLYWPDGKPMPHEESPMAVALRENRPIRGCESVAERPDGSRVSFIPYPTPLHSPLGELVGGVNMLVDITHRKADESAQMKSLQLLAREVDHRANNMLATIQALARMTRADTIDSYVAKLLGRISAVSRAHTLLAETRWRSADLRRILEEETAVVDGGERVRLDGPDVALRSEVAQSLAMVIHELTTNATKYGALSTGVGRVNVTWSVQPDDIVVVWTECDGPVISTSPRANLGIKLIESAVKGQLNGNIVFDWCAEGLNCTIKLPGAHGAVA
jgi:PAS domain S-box-containing protein